MTRLFIALAGLLVFSLPVHAKVVENFKSGGWSGSAFVNDSTGLLSSCVAIARYRSGISMSVEVDSVYNWWIGFSADHWKMTAGEKIALRYRIDSGDWQYGTATAISPQLARMEMPADGYIIRRFRRGRTMYVADESYDYQFRLTGTSRMLARLARCVEQNTARHGAGPALPRDGDATPAAPAEKKPSVQAPEAVSEAAPGPEPERSSLPRPDDAQLRLEATQALFNLMGRTGQTQLKLVATNERDAEFEDLHAVAGSDARMLAAHVFPEGTFDSQTDIMALLLYEAARACEGDFSSRFSADSVGGEELFAGRASCAAGDAEILDRYAIVPRAAGGVVVFAVTDTSVGEGSGGVTATSGGLTDSAFHEAAAAIGG